MDQNYTKWLLEDPKVLHSVSQMEVHVSDPLKSKKLFTLGLFALSFSSNAGTNTEVPL